VLEAPPPDSQLNLDAITPELQMRLRMMESDLAFVHTMTRREKIAVACTTVRNSEDPKRFSSRAIRSKRPRGDHVEDVAVGWEGRSGR
jgi:hypothetical protein